MALTLTVNGTGYSYPQTGDENWGDQSTLWAQAVTLGMLQKAGGTFTLTADVDFGSSFGLKAAYLKSRSSNISTAGLVRLANTESIGWRNAAANADLLLSVDSSNNLTFNGSTVLIATGGALVVSGGGTGFSSYAAGDMLYASGTTTFSKLNIGTANYVLSSNGTAPVWALIVNAMIDAAAAIDRSKIANGTANHVLINSGTGAMSSEAQLAGTRGGTGVSSTATFPTSGVVVTEAATQTLTNKTLTTPKIAYAQTTITSAASPYSATNANSTILANATGGAITVNLPAAASNTGLVLNIKKTDSSVNVVTVDGNASETIDGQTTFLLHFQYEEITIACDGSNWNLVGYVPVSGTYTPTFTGVSNVQGLTAQTFHFTKNKNEVTVFGTFLADPTTGGNLMEFRFTLPVASNFASQYDCAGVGTNNGSATRFFVNADTTNDQAFVGMIPGGGGNELCYTSFMYTVI